MRCYKNDPQNNKGNNRANDACGLTSKAKPKGEISAIELSRNAREGFAEWLEGQDSEELQKQFLWFIKEREQVRKNKEAGLPRPWSTDEILDKTKFTNIYRTDDKVSRFIFSKVEDLSGPLLVYNLLLSRLLNRVDVLNKILPAHPAQPSTQLLEGEAIMMNSGAYQISPGMVKLSKYGTNRETIVHYPPLVYKAVYEAITSTTSIKEAVLSGNKAYGGHINFAMFQVVLDYHHLTNHYDECSDIPIGQGAMAVVDKLGGLDVLQQITGMRSWDVEHAACEFRKYLHRQDKVLSRYSYVENSMGIKD